MKRRQLRHRRKGAMLILVALMLIIVLVMTVFSVDIAYMQLTRTQLRIATDSAARAGAETLVRSQSVDQARNAAKAAALANRVARQGLQLRDEEILFGRTGPADGQLFVFENEASPYNAVRVLGNRTSDSLDGEVNLFLGGMLGTETFAPHVQATASSITRDIALVLDRSGSMQRQNKINDLKTAVTVFLDQLDSTSADERVSLSSYSTTGRKDIDMTSNLIDIRDSVNSFEASGWTAIGQGLQHGTDSLANDAQSRPYADKIIVLMTDGIQNRPPDAETVVPTILDRNQIVYTISFGSGANQSLMRDIADQTGGQHYHAPNGNALIAIFEEIGRTVGVVLTE